MTDNVRSELLKLRSTRTNLFLFLAMIALVLFFVLIQGLVTNRFDLSRLREQRDLLGVGGIGALFAALIGAMAVTSEFRHGTIRPTFVYTPRRERVIWAKLAASFLMGLAFGALAEGLAYGIGYLILRARGVELALGTGEALHLVLGTIGMAALWAGLGVGVGALIRNQIGAIIGLIVWLFVVESILVGLVPDVGRFAPGAAGGALAGDNSPELLPAATGGLVLVCWVAVLAAAGVVATVGRDVD